MTTQAANALKGGQSRDLSGGPNIRDAASELAQNEVEDSWNVSFDERGGAASRLGYAKYNGTQFDASTLVKNIWWSPILATTITQTGAKLYKGTSAVSVKTFTTDGLVTFAELNSLLVANHPVDGLFTSADGATWTAVADADAPKGNGTCIATWQNKLYVGRSDGGVQWSAAGDPTSYVSTDFNKLWEHDQRGVVGLHIGSGQDILGRPGLLAFKQDSTYRIDDSSTGAYTTVDATVGAAGPLAVVGVGARVITISKHGIFWWREDQTGMVNASDQLLPLWDSGQVNFAQQALWCAGRKGNRALFSLTRGTSTANDLAIEFHPDEGWVAPRSDAVSCYAVATGTTDTLYGGSPTVDGRVYTLGVGGTDDGAAIAWRLQTKWFEMNSGFRATVWQLRAHGRGSGTVTALKDYATAGGNSAPFDLNSTMAAYDSGLTYDAGVTYAIPAVQNTQALYGSIGLCRQFSLKFEGSSAVVAQGQQVLGVGAPPDVGAFAIFGLEWLYTPLGLS